jgi:hypothetical protein
LNNIVRAILAASLCIVLAACANAPKVALKPEVKQGIRRVAIVDIPEPASYFMNPGAAPGGGALYMFGAIGGAILGGIEANRQESATTKFTSAVQPLNPGLSTIVLTQIEQGLSAKGYDTVRVPVPPKTSDGKGYDFTKIEAAHDAILVTALFAGYAVESGSVVPRISLSASLHTRQGGDKIFSDAYLYGTKKFGQMVLVESDPKFTLQSLDAVYANTGVALEGLRVGAGKVAERFVSDL